SGW
ncbi:RHS Repeat containing protein, partial [Escherichia coli EC96038]